MVFCVSRVLYCYELLCACNIVFKSASSSPSHLASPYLILESDPSPSLCARVWFRDYPLSSIWSLTVCIEPECPTPQKLIRSMGILRNAFQLGAAENLQIWSYVHWVIALIIHAISSTWFWVRPVCMVLSPSWEWLLLDAILYSVLSWRLEAADWWVSSRDACHGQPCSMRYHNSFFGRSQPYIWDQ